MVRGRFSALLVAIVFAIAFAAAPAHAQMKLVKPAGGFPVKITKSGSYILDANLLVGVILPDAIKVSVSNVSINLNGFAIIGPAAGSGMGVDAVGQNNVTVTNGTITGMGGAGISTGNNGTKRPDNREWSRRLGWRRSGLRNRMPDQWIGYSRQRERRCDQRDRRDERLPEQHHHRQPGYGGRGNEYGRQHL
jgi:hypothetical protein